MHEMHFITRSSPIQFRDPRGIPSALGIPWEVLVHAGRSTCPLSLGICLEGGSLGSVAFPVAERIVCLGDQALGVKVGIDAVAAMVSQPQTVHHDE